MSDSLKSTALCLGVSLFALVASLCALQAVKYSARNIREDLSQIRHEALGVETELRHNVEDNNELTGKLYKKIEALESKTQSLWYSGSPVRKYRFFNPSIGGAATSVIDIEGHGDSSNFDAERVIVRKEFQGFVYIQQKDGSFKVVKP